MFAPQIVMIYFPTLKYLLIKSLVLLPLWIFQMSSHIIAMSDFGNTLIIWGLEVTVILLKIWLSLIIVSTTSAKSKALAFSKKYKIPIIFRYDLDYGSQGVSTFSKSMRLAFLTYFSITWKSREKVTLLVTIIIPVWSIQMKSTIISDFMFFSALLMLVI